MSNATDNGSTETKAAKDNGNGSKGRKRMNKPFYEQQKLDITKLTIGPARTTESKNGYQLCTFDMASDEYGDCEITFGRTELKQVILLAELKPMYDEAVKWLDEWTPKGKTSVKKKQQEIDALKAQMAEQQKAFEAQMAVMQQQQQQMAALLQQHVPQQPTS